MLDFYHGDAILFFSHSNQCNQNEVTWENSEALFLSTMRICNFDVGNSTIMVTA